MRILIVSLALFMVMSCKNSNQPTTQTEDLLSSELPEDFLGFYMKFHSDSLYQVDHIVFPLAVQATGLRWAKEDWRMHKQMTGEGFVQKFVNLNGIIIEYIQDAQRIYTIERRFVKANEGYNLIYYKVDNVLEQNPEWEKAPS